MKKWSSMTSVPVAFYLLSSPLVVHVAGKSAPDNDTESRFRLQTLNFLISIFWTTMAAIADLDQPLSTH